MSTTENEFKELDHKTLKHGLRALGLFAVYLISDKIMPGVANEVLYKGGDTLDTIFTIGQLCIAVGAVGEGMRGFAYSIDSYVRLDTNQRLAELSRSHSETQPELMELETTQ